MFLNPMPTSRYDASCIMCSWNMSSNTASNMASKTTSRKASNMAYDSSHVRASEIPHTFNITITSIGTPFYVVVSLGATPFHERTYFHIIIPLLYY